MHPFLKWIFIVGPLSVGSYLAGHDNTGLGLFLALLGIIALVALPEAEDKPNG